MAKKEPKSKQKASTASVEEPLKTEDVEGQKASTSESKEEAMENSLRTEGDGKQKASATDEAASQLKEVVTEESSRTEDERKQKASAAEETASESKEEAPFQMDEGEESSEVDEDTDEETAAEPWESGPATKLGHGGLILALFETPSGFAIFSYDGVKLLEQNACQNIWADFADHTVAKRVVPLSPPGSSFRDRDLAGAYAVWLVCYETFEDKLSAIDRSIGVSDKLAAMIKEHIGCGQKLAVENEDYKMAIKKSLQMDCLYDPAVEELMWGLKVQMPYLVPKEKQQPAEEDRFPMSEGMKFLLNFHQFRFKPDMMVTRRIIELAGVVHACDLCVNKHSTNLHSVAVHLKKISDIDTRDWDLMKIATALKLICFPDRKVAAPRSTSKATECATNHETVTGEKERVERIWFGEEVASVIDYLIDSSCNLSDQRKKRQIPPSLAPVSAIERYTDISSHQLHRMNEPGISSIHIHPSKDIVATGGIDTTAVLFDRPSGQILCTLAGHSKKITSLKFVNRDELVITGSADKTVRIWQGSEDGNYSCIHTLEDHTDAVEAVTVHATQQYFVSASMDNSWRFYYLSTGSCLTQVREDSEQEGYTSASFHPDGLLLGTGTTAVVKIWDVRTQSNVAKLPGHIGPVNAMSFSGNGYHVATAARNGVMIWDVRKYRYLRTISPYCSDTPTNAGKELTGFLEFDSSGSYLAIGGSDIRVCHAEKIEWSLLKKLPDLSRKGKVTSVKFGADAKYIAVGSMDCDLRIFGLPGDK
ncbi:hypothetical protein EJB05_23209 [Eragrostis curvula]|uniref:Pre-mRNA-processing factor 19 n=1 Tax=Eragrostis curvula TaxID=38414 RepID=A0A5J9V5N8_9POAL|nr:hypothetical protein EJB05_23209 [Eragrostis curvula]